MEPNLIIRHPERRKSGLGPTEQKKKIPENRFRSEKEGPRNLTSAIDEWALRSLIAALANLYHLEYPVPI